MVDILIIGAGSAGAHSAYFFKEAGYSVKVVDYQGIAQGASGAAGAFISPRLGKGGPLQRLTNEAFLFSISFYKERFANLFYQTGILRVPKDREDWLKFQEQIPFIDVEYELKRAEDIAFLTPYAKEFGGIFFPQGGIVRPKELCEALLEGIEVERRRVTSLDGLKAKNILIATGAWDELLPFYIRLGKLAGSRIDAKGIGLPVSVHKRISISKSIDGISVIGATHKRVERVEDWEDDIEPLIEEAKRMSGMDIEPLKRYRGVRPSVDDHFPYAGMVRQENGEPLQGCYMLGGFGGRGFVFGAWMAKRVVEYVSNNKALPHVIDSDRYYQRWRKRYG